MGYKSSMLVDRQHIGMVFTSINCWWPPRRDGVFVDEALALVDRTGPDGEQATLIKHRERP